MSWGQSTGPSGLGLRLRPLCGGHCPPGHWQGQSPCNHEGRAVPAGPRGPEPRAGRGRHMPRLSDPSHAFLAFMRPLACAHRGCLLRDTVPSWAPACRSALSITWAISPAHPLDPGSPPGLLEPLLKLQQRPPTHTTGNQPGPRQEGPGTSHRPGKPPSTGDQEGAEGPEPGSADRQAGEGVWRGRGGTASVVPCVPQRMESLGPKLAPLQCLAQPPYLHVLSCVSTFPDDSLKTQRCLIERAFIFPWESGPSVFGHCH